MIRDHIVVGICDRSLSEQLQLDASLTLEKAMTLTRQHEAVHEQQSLLRNASKQELAVDFVKKKPPLKKGSHRAARGQKRSQPFNSSKCSCCGN